MVAVHHRLHRTKPQQRRRAADPQISPGLLRYIVGNGGMPGSGGVQHISGSIMGVLRSDGRERSCDGGGGVDYGGYEPVGPTTAVVYRQREHIRRGRSMVRAPMLSMTGGALLVTLYE